MTDPPPPPPSVETAKEALRHGDALGAEIILRGLLDGTIHTPGSQQEDLDALAQQNDEFEALFDLGQTSAPKNRLPKDWKP